MIAQRENKVQGTVRKMKICQVRTGALITPLQPHSTFISVHCGAACHCSVKKERVRDGETSALSTLPSPFSECENPLEYTSMGYYPISVCLKEENIISEFLMENI